MLKVINIKENLPDTEYAVFQMSREIYFAKKENINVLVVIHGYGSNGVGGAIKKAVKDELTQLKSKKEIIDFSPGEQFGEMSELKSTLNKLYPETILNDHMQNLNSGVTVVWVVR